MLRVPNDYVLKIIEASIPLLVFLPERMVKSGIKETIFFLQQIFIAD